MSRAAALVRLAAALAEAADAVRELAALEEPAEAKSTPRRRPVPVSPPIAPPTELDQARARRDLAGLGAVPGRRRAP